MGQGLELIEPLPDNYLFLLAEEARNYRVIIPKDYHYQFLSTGAKWGSWSTQIVWNHYQIAELRINQPVRQRMV